MAIPILSDIFGSKPAIAPWQNVLLSDAQMQALMSNIKNFGNIEQLGNLWQNYILGAYEHAVPGFGNLLSGITGAAKDEISQATQLIQGVMPKDIVAATYGSGAMQNLLSGLQGAPAGIANLARNFGTTSLNLMNQGANLLGNAAQRWQQLLGFGQTTMAPIQQMLITPQEQFGANLTNEVNQQRTQQNINNMNAAPNPIAKGLSDLVAYITAAYASHGASLGSKPPAAMDPNQYLAGPVSTPTGDAYGLGGNPSYSGDVTTPGYPSGGANPGGIAPVSFGGVDPNNTAPLPTGGADPLNTGGTSAPYDPYQLLNTSIGYQLPDNTPYASTGGAAGMANSYAGAYPAWLQGAGLSGMGQQYAGYPALPGLPETY